MAEGDAVALVRATRADAPLLGNLLELYVHDLSGLFPVELGADGRYGYAKLPLYWDEPASRYAFLIRRGGRIAGFALATRGLRPGAAPDQLDVAEFFVLRAHRRAGVGSLAAFALWNALPDAGRCAFSSAISPRSRSGATRCGVTRATCSPSGRSKRHPAIGACSSSPATAAAEGSGR